MRKLDAGVHVVSGTPGRVKDMMEKQKVRGPQPLLLLLLLLLAR
jgi:superfamily II DNA/RNA helicase